MKGVYAVYKNQFQIGIGGLESTDEQFVTPKDLETFSPSFDNGVEEWNPMDMEGWVRRLMTGKGITVDFSGKRNVGDPGNDYIASMAMKNGSDVETKFKWNFPSGASVVMDVVVNVTNVGGGDSTNVAPLEFQVMSNGKPTFTEATTTQTTQTTTE